MFNTNDIPQELLKIIINNYIPEEYTKDDIKQELKSGEYWDMLKDILNQVETELDELIQSDNLDNYLK